jgi:flagellar basal body-associated protein FliL
MARQDNSTLTRSLAANKGTELGVAQGATRTQKRSALGVGIITLVTIMVVLLLAAFSVLSLVSARSDLRLSEMSTTQVQSYYAADSEATAWYAELDAFAAQLSGSPESYEEQLTLAGYLAESTADGELRVSRGFAINDTRTLMVTIAVNDERTTTIRQWQS